MKESVGKSELKCNYSNQKSFYGKAKTEVICNDLILFSYGSKVAAIIGEGSVKAVVYTTTPSQTSLKHIKEFLKQNGFVANNQKQILKDYTQER